MVDLLFACTGNLWLDLVSFVYASSIDFSKLEKETVPRAENCLFKKLNEISRVLLKLNF